MPRLMNQSKGIQVCSHLERADSMWKRMKGLLGRKSLSTDSALWIDPCSSIHTFFMQFPIDVAFVDKDLKVTKVRHHIEPWKLVFSTLKTRSVFEFSAGALNKEKIEIGDQLHVDP